MSFECLLHEFCQFFCRKTGFDPFAIRTPPFLPGPLYLFLETGFPDAVEAYEFFAKIVIIVVHHENCHLFYLELSAVAEDWKKVIPGHFISPVRF